MNTRRWIIPVWAGLCLAGIAATSALNAGSPGKPDSPYVEPTPTKTHPVDCQKIADDMEQARAEAERKRQEALRPSATSEYGRQFTVTGSRLPEECVDELEDRGLRH
ncbi:hypothetical protein ACWC5C_28185 [Streptomyces sp. NPDC001700]